MYCLACTGGIGSGKSYVLRIFSALGVPVYFSDDRTKELYNQNQRLIKELSNLLGEDILVNGVLNKAAMAAKIFADKSLLSQVNSIVHPIVLEDFIEWKKEQSSKGMNFVIIESAIILEIPFFLDETDGVLVVTAPEDVRIERVTKRDGLSPEAVKTRMDKQMSDKERIDKADFVIFADGQRAVLPQVLEVYNRVNNLMTK
ncbi:MAG: dephospho-CoA kinase [Bacteroidales bacterium]